MSLGPNYSAIPAYPSFPASPNPMIPLPIYMACTFTGQFSGAIAFIAASLTYGTELLSSFIDHPGGIHSDYPTDFLTFSVIVYLVIRSNVTKIPIPGLLKIIVRDATCYFLVIFASHFVYVIFLLFASVSTPS